MSLATAVTLWGEAAVARALAEADVEPVTRELAEAVKRHADPPGAFAAWALAQSWPRYCAIVRIVSGVTREELLGGEE